MGKHVHRSSSLKQCNKPFKGKRSSKKKRKDGGNESNKTSDCSHKCQSKAERLLRFKQLRQNKAEKAREISRYGIPSVQSLAPKIVMILPLSANIDALGFKNEILQLANGTCDDHENKPVTFSLPHWCKRTSKEERHNSRLTLIDVNPFKYFDDSDMFQLSDDCKTKYWKKELLYYVLDIAKAATIILILMQDNDCTFEKSPFDPFGYELMSALRLQGMPTVVGCLVNNPTKSNVSCEKKKEKLIYRFFKSEFGSER
jgi:pre-rRNA-processing protein TSR1